MVYLSQPTKETGKCAGVLSIFFGKSETCHRFSDKILFTFAFTL